MAGVIPQKTPPLAIALKSWLALSRTLEKLGVQTVQALPEIRGIAQRPGLFADLVEVDHARSQASFVAVETDGPEDFFDVPAATRSNSKVAWPPQHWPRLGPRGNS